MNMYVQFMYEYVLNVLRFGRKSHTKRLVGQWSCSEASKKTRRISYYCSLKLLAEQASRFEETLGSEKTLRIPELWKAAENFMAGGF